MTEDEKDFMVLQIVKKYSDLTLKQLKQASNLADKELINSVSRLMDSKLITTVSRNQKLILVLNKESSFFKNTLKTPDDVPFE